MPKRYRKKTTYRRRRMPKNRRTRSKKGRRRTRKAPLRKKVLRLGKRVAKVSRILNATTATKIYRQRVYTPVQISAENLGAIIDQAFGDITFVESAITKLQYYNPSVPLTPIEADGNTGTYQRSFRVSSSYSWTGRNSYQVPIWVDAWLCMPKSMSNNTPATSWQEGLTSKGIAVTATMINPYDSADFKNIWRIVKHKRRLLAAGTQMSMFHRAKPFNFDPSVRAEFPTFDYFPKWDGSSLLIRIEGAISHLSTDLSFIGSGVGGLDMVKNIFHTVTYDAGFNANLLEIVDGAQAMATPVTGVKPFTDNLAFQVP